MLDRIDQDLINMSVFVPEEKRGKFIEEVTQCLNGSSVTLDKQLLTKFNLDGIVYKALRRQLMQISAPQRRVILNIFCEVKSQGFEATKVVYKIVEDRRGLFIDNFERLMGWNKKDGLLYRKAGFENIENFRKTGILPSEWVEILEKKPEGQDLLADYVANFEKTTPLPDSGDDVTEKKEDLPSSDSGDLSIKKNRSRFTEDGLVPREKGASVLEKMLKISKVSKVELERMLSWPVNGFYPRKKGSPRITLLEVRLFIEKQGIANSHLPDEDLVGWLLSYSTNLEEEAPKDNPSTDSDQSQRKVSFHNQGKKFSGPPKRKRGERLSENKLVPKAHTVEVLDNIRSLCGIKKKLDLAKILGINPAVVSRMYDNGNSRLRMIDLEYLASIYDGVSIDDMVRIDGNEVIARSLFASSSKEVAAPHMQEELKSEPPTEEVAEDSAGDTEKEVGVAESSGVQKVSQVDLTPPDIKKALSDALSSALDRRVFLGALMEQLQDCDLRFSKKSMVLTVKKEGKGKFEINLNNYPF